MGYWGWRPMLGICVSVLVVGCSTTQEAASTALPTLSPPVTLIARVPDIPTPLPAVVIPVIPPPASPTPVTYVIQAGDTLLGIALRFGVPLEQLKAANSTLDPLTLPIGHTIIIPSPSFNEQGIPILPTNTPAALTLLTPNCTASISGQIQCLGLVRNDMAGAVERVIVEVRLFGRQGELLAQGETGVEQYVIPSGQIAPYRLIVDTEWAAYGAAQVVLKSADPVDGQSNRFMMLEMQDESGWMENGVFRVMANLRNPETGSARLMRAILTLQNGQGQISGYRIVPLSGSLASGESRLIQFSIPLQPDMAAFQLFVEAIRE